MGINSSIESVIEEAIVIEIEKIGPVRGRVKNPVRGI
jgi:hypothetical protein